MRGRPEGISLACSLIIAVAMTCWALVRPAPALPLAASVNVANTPFTYDHYARVLKTYVNDQGMVNYKALKANNQSLDAFVSALGKLDTEIYEMWNGPEKIAFWINAYNGLTLAAIIRHYPIRASRWEHCSGSSMLNDSSPDRSAVGADVAAQDGPRWSQRRECAR